MKNGQSFKWGDHASYKKIGLKLPPVHYSKSQCLQIYVETKLIAPTIFHWPTFTNISLQTVHFLIKIQSFSKFLLAAALKYVIVDECFYVMNRKLNEYRNACHQS